MQTPMREDLLHFIWKYKKLQLGHLMSSNNESVEIQDAGSHNQLAGPDFFNAKVKIAGQLWAGNVEIHVKSSDWYSHNHEKDLNYDSVVLHVVWEDDGAVYRSDGSEIPTLELKNYIPRSLLQAYRTLFDRSAVTFINCENDIGQVDGFVLENWLERLYFERLERKSGWVEALLVQRKNDWENVLFLMLLKNFGLKINGEAFLSLANALDFSVVRKVQSDRFSLESIFYGMSHLLDDANIVDDYYLQLQKEYGYLGKKFNLRPEGVLKPEFFRLRPPNFPTIRLSQLANLYTRHKSLFTKIMATSDLKEIYDIFDVGASPYWNTHYTFGKSGKKSVKKLTFKFIDLLIVNAILPLKFCYARHLGREADETIIEVVSNIKREENSIVQNFGRHGILVNDAKGSQALLELFDRYCTPNKCLQCAVGNRLLSGIN